VSGKRWRSLASAILAGLLPSVARADSSVDAPAATRVILSFGTPPLAPPAPEPSSDPPAADLQLPTSSLEGPGRLTCELCGTDRPAYRLESHARRGLAISGAVIAGIGFGFALAVAAGTTEGARKWNGVPFDNGGLVVPILGPWITLGALKPNCGGLYNDEPAGCTRVHTQSGWRAILIVDGLVQLLGATLITVGLALPREELVIAGTVKARVVPTPLGSSSHGLALTGTF
jgi:hypothetical protein